MRSSTPDLPAPLAPLLLLVLAAAGTAIALTGQQVMLLGAAFGLLFLLLVWQRPHLGILLFLSTFLFTYPEALQGYGLLTPNNVLGVVFCVLILLHVWTQRNLWALSDPRIRILLAISVVFLISTWLARSPPPGLEHLDRTSTELWDFFTQFAFVVFMIHFIRTRRHLNLVFALLIFAILLTAVSALLAPGADYRATAAFGIKAANNANRLGFWSLVGVVILWYLQQELRSSSVRFVLIALIGMLLLVILLTGSRSALINVMVFAVVVAVESGFQLRRLVSTAVVVGLLALLVLKLVPQENLERSTAFDGQTSGHSEAAQSAQGRIRVAQTALQVYSDANLLLGVAPGNFRWIRQLDYDLERLSLHNGYLWALLSGGAAALVLYLWLFWTSWRDLRRLECAPSTASMAPRWMVKSTRTILLLFLMFSLFAEAWLEITPFLLIALTIVMIRLRPVELPPRAVA